MFFFDFQVPEAVLEASWRSWRHLGPLEGLLKRLERILRALGGFLESLGAILDASEALLDPSWTHLELIKSVFSRYVVFSRLCFAAAGGPVEGRGSIPKGIWLPLSGPQCLGS